jgi:ABC-2 type transport system ATP-binding protein
MLEIQGLTKRFDQLLAVDRLSFRAGAGEILGLVGPNGAGKTTTLRCAVGILPPTSGTVRICGHDLDREPVEAKRELAFIPDDPQLFEYLTVQEHLTFFGRIYKVADAGECGRRLLAQLELEDKRRSLPQELSRGMRQKLAIACALIHRPRVLFLDEPLTGLDPAAMRRMKDRFVTLAREGTCIVLSSHLLHLVEELAHRVLVIQGGRCVALGTLEEIVEAARLHEDADLEEAFLQVTREENGPPPAPEAEGPS